MAAGVILQVAHERTPERAGTEGYMPLHESYGGLRRCRRNVMDCFVDRGGQKVMIKRVVLERHTSKRVRRKDVAVADKGTPW